MLSRFWFDAPLLDDYDCFLDALGALAKAASPAEWQAHLFAFMNEHRLAGTRLAAQLQAWTTGGIDFRVPMLLGTLCVFGIFALVQAEFREEASGPIAAAAALLLLQWSYWEALLMASASTAHLGTAFFSVAALYFALRPGARSAALCAVGGILAAYSQANGLFVLPLAAAACMVLGKRRRAVVFMVLAALIWAHYFVGFSRPTNHPMLRALDDPVKTVQLFLIIVGGIVPSLAWAQVAGAVILAGLGWITWRGLWRRHPTVFLWVAFVLVSAATIAVARAGFGLFWGSRYAINTALLMAILVFAAFSLTRPWRRGAQFLALGAAALLWSAILFEALPHMRERSLRGHLLAEVEPSGAPLGLPRFVGMQHPHQEHAARILEVAEAHRWYVAPRRAIPPPSVAVTAERPAAAPPLGVIDEIIPGEASVVLRGWSGIPATVQGRRFIIHSAYTPRTARLEALHVREDVAVALRQPDLLLSGFNLRLGFGSAEEASEASRSICMFEEAPAFPMAEILRPGIQCR